MMVDFSDFTEFRIRKVGIRDDLTLAGVVKILDHFPEFQTASFDRKKCNPRRYEAWKFKEDEILRDGLYADEAGPRICFADAPVVFTNDGNEMVYWYLHGGYVDLVYYVSNIFANEEIEIRTQSNLGSCSGFVVKNGEFLRNL